jgi:hypothetical protein
MDGDAVKDEYPYAAMLWVKPTHFPAINWEAALVYIATQPRALAVPFALLCLRASEDVAVAVLQLLAKRGEVGAVREGLALCPANVPKEWFLARRGMQIPDEALAAAVEMDPGFVDCVLPIVLGLEQTTVGLWNRVETVYLGSIGLATKLVPHVNWLNPHLADMYRRQNFQVDVLHAEDTMTVHLTTTATTKASVKQTFFLELHDSPVTQAVAVFHHPADTHRLVFRSMVITQSDGA